MKIVQKCWSMLINYVLQNAVYDIILLCTFCVLQSDKLRIHVKNGRNRYVFDQ